MVVYQFSSSDPVLSEISSKQLSFQPVVFLRNEMVRGQYENQTDGIKS